MRGDEVGNLDARTRALVDVGAPVVLAHTVADLLHLFSYLDVVDLAHELDREFPVVAQIYYAASAHLHVHTHLTAVSRLDRHDRSHALARLSLREDLYASVRAATADIVRTTSDDAAADERLDTWGRRKARRLPSLGASPKTADEPANLADLCAAARQIRLVSG
jgi:glutamate dehydrogenase